MAACEDWTRYLTVWSNRSISGACSFLDAQFKDIMRSAISARTDSNSLSACLIVILNPHCRYSLWTCLIPSSLFFIFRFLIILPVENIRCRDMLFRKPMPLICMRSHHRATLLYLSRITLGTFGTVIGSTFWILWRNSPPENVAHWVHICTQPYRHLFGKLRGFQDFIINCV